MGNIDLNALNASFFSQALSKEPNSLLRDEKGGFSRPFVKESIIKLQFVVFFR